MFKKMLLLPFLIALAIGLRIGFDKLTARPVNAEADLAAAYSEETPTPGTKEPPPPALASEKEAPTLVLEQTTIDAKEVLKGDPQKYVFHVKNSGIGKLEIVAKSTCGCTVAKFDRFIEPGQSGKIEAELRTSNLQGKVQKRIIVQTNDPKKPTTDLMIAATIRPVVEVIPIGSPILDLPFGESANKEYHIHFYGREPIEIKSIACSVPFAEAKLQREQKNDGKPLLFKLTVHKDAPTGRSDFAITLETTSKREPSVSFRVFCEKGILIMPPAVSFNPQQGSAERIVLLNKRAGVFHIKKITSDDCKLECFQEDVNTKTGTALRLHVKYNGILADMLPRLVKVETDDPQQPILEIPVTTLLQQSLTSANIRVTPQ